MGASSRSDEPRAASALDDTRLLAGDLGHLEAARRPLGA
jgi:hypothetical protein